MTALWVIAFAGAVWWLWQSVCVVRTLRAVRPLPAGTIDVADSAAPLVSVICPARDEADAIEAATQERLTDPAPWIEFIFVNDRSTDGTGEILDRVTASDTRARVLHIDELPGGWLGKVHAQRVGLEQAAIRSDGWYLFSDGDTHVHPGCIAAALAWAEQEQADHVALTPRIVKGSWLLKLCIAPLMRTRSEPARSTSESFERSVECVGGAFIHAGVSRRAAGQRLWVPARCQMCFDLATWWGGGGKPIRFSQTDYFYQQI